MLIFLVLPGSLMLPLVVDNFPLKQHKISTRNNHNMNRQTETAETDWKTLKSIYELESEPECRRKKKFMSDFPKHRGRCYGGCHAVRSEKNNLLEFLERSVRGEALSQSNSARISDIVATQTAKPQKIRK